MVFYDRIMEIKEPKITRKFNFLWYQVDTLRNERFQALETIPLEWEINPRRAIVNFWYTCSGQLLASRRLE